MSLSVIRIPSLDSLGKEQVSLMSVRPKRTLRPFLLPRPYILAEEVCEQTPRSHDNSVEHSRRDILRPTDLDGQKAPPPIGGFQDKLKTSEAVQCQVNRVDSVLLLIKKHGCKTVSQRCRNGNIWSLLYTDGARILF